MNNNPTLKGRLIALAVGGLILLLLAEALIRVIMPHWQEFYNGRFMRLIEVPGYGLVTTGKPGFDGYFAQNNGDFRIKININDFGLRNPDPVAAADGRIWIVGDSMAFGWGVEQDQTYTSVIGKILGQPTYNIASPGTDVCGYQALYARMPKTVRPKAVIVGLILENDMLEYDCRASATPAAEKKAQEPDAPSLIGTKLFFTHYSALYNFLAVALKRVGVIRKTLIAMGLVNKEHGYKSSFTKDEIGPVAASTADELLRMKGMVPPGVPFAVLLAPGRFELRDGDIAYKNMRIRISEELAKRGIDVIDPYDSFAVAGFKAVHFAHDGHWSALGHRLAGKKAAAWLKTQLVGSQ